MGLWPAVHWNALSDNTAIRDTVTGTRIEFSVGEKFRHADAARHPSITLCTIGIRVGMILMELRDKTNVLWSVYRYQFSSAPYDTPRREAPPPPSTGSETTYPPYSTYRSPPHEFISTPAPLPRLKGATFLIPTNSMPLPSIHPTTNCQPDPGPPPPARNSTFVQTPAQSIHTSRTPAISTNFPSICKQKRIGRQQLYRYNIYLLDRAGQSSRGSIGESGPRSRHQGFRLALERPLIAIGVEVNSSLRNCISFTRAKGLSISPLVRCSAPNSPSEHFSKANDRHKEPHPSLTAARSLNDDEKNIGRTGAVEAISPATRGVLDKAQWLGQMVDLTYHNTPQLPSTLSTQAQAPQVHTCTSRSTLRAQTATGYDEAKLTTGKEKWPSDKFSLHSNKGANILTLW
ncbi:hypothetical protein C7212DRAFT_363949 [Tuber magnatum]|uniref:Uncharacterized protein n=1 Tax=Tuber magnatum TaxID=42249 RepID=A0A317SP45_9PEZI|nr:hypothetical protein C7212DRAFT_363949 [Tuber magnatum]